MVILLAASVLVDLYILNDISRKARKGFWRKFYLVTSVVCWVFIIVTLCLPRRSEDSGILTVMWMLYSYLTVYVGKLGYVICSLIGRLVRAISHSRSKRHPARLVGAAVGITLFIMMWWGVGVTRRAIQVNEVEVESPKIPRSFNGYTIAQISDIHVGTWGTDTTFVSALVDSVNALHPDLILFTGDIVNRRTEELKPFISVLSRLKAPDGVLSILGNHDYGDYVDWSNPDDRLANNRELAADQERMGWDLLNNTRRFIAKGSDSIMVIGVENIGDPPFPTYGDLEKALPASSDSIYHQNDTRFKILMTHNPAHWDKEVSHKTNIDLSLAGHTHAMQMMIKIGGWEWSPAKFRYEQWGGMYERLNDRGHKTRLYVNIGAGEVGMPSRILNAYPEITLFTLKHLGN